MPMLSMRWLTRLKPTGRCDNSGRPEMVPEKVLQMLVRDNQTNKDTWVDVPEINKTE